MNKYLIYSSILIFLSFIIGLILYSQFPAQVATHWNFQGEVNGYMSKFWGLFLIPLISIVLFFLLIFLPKIDPLRKDMAGFKQDYYFFIALILSFMFYVYLLTLFWNASYRFNISIFMIPAFSLLFFYTGIILEKSKRNWFLGIRNPWTLSSEYVWDKTHKLSGLLFKICAGVMLMGLLFQRAAMLLVIVPLIMTLIITMIYSYVQFKKSFSQSKKNL